MLPTWALPLKDLPNRVQLPPALAELHARVIALDEKTPAFGEAALELAGKLGDFLDEELTRLTEQRIALGDSNSLRRRLVDDPRRQADQTLGLVKSRFQAERAEWTRRVQKQQAEVLDAVDLELKKLALESTVAKNQGTTVVADSWKASFARWLDDSLTTWGRHVGELAPAKLRTALDGDLAQLGKQLGEKADVQLARPAAMNHTPARLEYPALTEHTEVPSVMEAFFETFKNGLNTVAMLAGLVIIPVVGNMSHEQPTALRATIMTALVVPILGFAVWNTRSQRRRLSSKLVEKAHEKLRKAVETWAKTRVDRYAKEVDRHAGNWLQATQNDVATELEAQVTSVFARKEASVAGELARASLQADRLQDQLAALKQARSFVVNTLAPEARRRVEAP